MEEKKLKWDRRRDATATHDKTIMEEGNKESGKGRGKEEKEREEIRTERREEKGNRVREKNKWRKKE